MSINNQYIDLNDKVVLITGGTGSFGQAFVKETVSRYKPRKLIILSRDEQKHVSMQHSEEFCHHDCLRFFIGDVRDESRLRMAMRGVDYVVHAAALKHVHIAEYNPFECVHTNILGAQNVVKAALDCGVEKVIAISSDKAVNPINLYGATKLAADKIFIAANALVGDIGTSFSVVRYGNVLGSNGSIIPLFRKMLAEGVKSLPITDERMTRFWVTLKQAIDLVLYAFDVMQGGEIFTPKAPSMRLTDMVSALAPNVPTHKIGIRPGEKVHEVLISSDDTSEVLDGDDYFVICPHQDPRVKGVYLNRGYKLLEQTFRYSSNNNSQWLDADGLKDLLKVAGL